MAQKRYLLYGHHAVEAALGNPERRVLKLFVSTEAATKLGNAYDPARHPKLKTLDKRDLDHILPKDAVHQGIAAEVEALDSPLLEAWLHQGKETPVLLLDQVTDPHNVGAIFRSAAAFGIGAIITTEANAPEETNVLAKAASGALDIVPWIRVSNLAQGIETLKKSGYWVAGLSASAEQTVRDAKLNRKTALVLGAEGKGMRRLTEERCDLLVKLPIDPKMESLNVSVAAAIACYELYTKG